MTNNKGDTISREALMQVLFSELANVPQPDTDADYYIGVKQGLKLAETIINNAPTVEYTFEEAFQKTICENKLYCPARQKGEWIITGEEQGALGITYKTRKCDKCGWEHSLVIPDNFCPRCGAKMQKGGEE